MPSPQAVTDALSVRFGRVAVRYGRYRYGQRVAGAASQGQRPVGVRVRTATQTYRTQADR